MALADGRRLYLPISHGEPKPHQVAICVPAEVAKVAGLDARPHWVVVSESNLDAETAHLRRVPGRGSPLYGRLENTFFQQVKVAFLRLQKEGGAVILDRTPTTSTPRSTRRR